MSGTRPIHEFGALPGLKPLFGKAILPHHGGPDVPAEEYAVDAVRVDADQLAIYQRLCGYDVSSVLPASFVHLLTFPLSMALMTRSDFPLPVLGLVHVRNRVTQHRPIDMGESVRVGVHAENLAPHPAGRQVDLVSEARVGDEVVWSEISTYLRPGRKDPGTHRDPGERPQPPAPQAFWRLPGDLGRRYAAVSGDSNPIHLSALSAKAFGFPHAIAHGMWLQARALAAVSSRLPAAYDVDIAFKTPAFLPSAVAFAAALTGPVWTLDVRAARTGKPHLAGTVTPAS